MALSYRKRVTIAPGVRLNISRKGVSSTIGVRGASINMGQNGTYINTGIPGTGFYSRKKIGGSRYAVPNKPNTTDSGCSVIAVLFLVFALLIGAGIYFFLEEDLHIVGVLLLVIVGISLIITLVSKRSNSPSAKAKKAEESFQASITLARDAMKEATDPIKKDILQNFISCMELTQKADETEAIIESLRKKIGNKEKHKLKGQLEQQMNKLSQLTEEFFKVQLDIDKGLSEKEKEAYRNLCERFEELLLSEKKWVITSSRKNRELKSSASTVINRIETSFEVGVFNFIKTEFDIPIFKGDGSKIYYIYPKFILIVFSTTNFEVVPIENVEIKFSRTRFIESGTAPADSKILEHTFMYVNKDGGRDMRYSYNPLLPVLEYAEIEIIPINISFQISNAVSTECFVDAFKILQGKSSPFCLSQFQINERYFNTINEAIENLVRLLEDLNSNSLFCTKIDNETNLDITLDGKQTTDVPRKIWILFLVDLLRCYTELGHSIDLKSREGLGLLIFASRTMGFPTFRYDFLQKINEELIQSIESFMNQIKASIERNQTPDEVFLISSILKGYNNDLQKKYLVLLYRIASITAKADGIITEHEEKWLSKLLSLGDGSLSQELEDPTSSFIEYMDSQIHAFDPLLEEAAKVIFQYQQASISLIQRKLSIGYNKAGRIMDQLEAAGVVSKVIGNTRELLIKSENELDLLFKNLKKNSQEDDSTQRKPDTEEKENITQKVFLPSQNNPYEELKNLIGLNTVKTEIETLANFIKIQQVREKKGLKSSHLSYHCVFTGNPGTGKTSVARIVANIYKDLGILKNGHLVETDRSGLVAEYIGQTAVKTNKIIDSAIDGVLFIDEAYALISGGNADYGKEAIATLLKRMEDNRDKLVVILAGYTDEMKMFIDSNPGLQSRFNRYIEFPDYSADELHQIFRLNLQKFDYHISDIIDDLLKDFFQKSVTSKDRNFGNARFARNLFEKTIERQANRLAKEVDLTNEKLSEICFVDLPLSS